MLSSRTALTALSVWIAIPGLVACGSSDAQAPGSPAPSTVKDETGWTTLLTGDWSRAPGTEGYTCARRTNTEDLYVNAFDAIKPLGTHHTLLTMGKANAPDGVTPCTAADNYPLSIFGSGVGTNPLELPDGLVVKVPKDTQLLLNLHLFNTGDQELTGTSGTRVRTIPKADVVDVAEGILAGTLSIDVPAGETKTTIGYCTMTSDVTIIAVAPHMHQLGIYEKVVAQSSSEGEVVLNDAPYDFNEQSYHLVEPVKMAKGDKVRVECTHKNTTPKDVTFGDSSLAEMCFAGLFRYPADGAPFICVDGLSFGSAPPTPTL